MKKMNYALFATVVIAMFLSSCAKENNKFDKILTDGEWKVTSWVETSSNIINTDESGTGAVDLKETTNSSNTITGTSQVELDYHEYAYSPGSTTFDESTTNSTTTITATFNEDGTYSMNTSKQYKTYSSRDESGPVSNFNYTDPADTYSETGYWNWANTTDTKTQISLSGVGTFDVTVEKDKVTFVNNTNSTDINNFDFGTPTVETTTNTHNLTFTATK